MKGWARVLVVGIVVLLAWPGLAAKKKKAKQQKKATPTATATATPVPDATPLPGLLLWEGARVGMTEAEVLEAFRGRAEAPAKKTVSEEGTYVGATIAEAKLGDSSFVVDFVFRSPEKTLQRVTLACTECYASEYSSVKRALVEAHGAPIFDEATSVDRRRAVWVVDGRKIQLRWVHSELLGRALRVLSVNFVEAERPEDGKQQDGKP